MMITRGRGGGPAARGLRRIRRRLPPAGAAAAAALLLSSCYLFGSFRTGPEGRSPHDTELRQHARDEDFTEALELTEADAGDDIGDELLRLLHRGLLLHYDGQYEASNQILQRAEEMIEDRYTRSVSRAALSLLTSDRSLAWLPNGTERLMVNYYGALNYLALGDVGEAAVEARRLSRWLELGADDDIDAAEAKMRRGMRYFAGSVFEAAGDMNNAAVAYRNVWGPGGLPTAASAIRPRFLELYDDVPADADDDGTREAGRAADSIPQALVGPIPEASAGGDVVIFVEEGFIAHRVERALNIPLFPEETDALNDSDEAVRLAAARCVASRGFGDSGEFALLFDDGPLDWRRDSEGRCVVRGARRSSSGDSKEESEEQSERSFYLMRVAWPEMQRSGLLGDLQVERLAVEAVSMPGAEADPTEVLEPDAGSRLRVSLSDAAIEEFESQLGGIVLKAVARSAAKYAVTRGIESELKKKDETLGEIAALAANAVGAVLERADTRCWHLLPDEVSVIRLQLPPGRHSLTVRIQTSRSDARLLDLGEVDVRDRSVHVISARIWP